MFLIDFLFSISYLSKERTMNMDEMGMDLVIFFKAISVDLKLALCR